MGQDDLGVEEAREVIGAEKWIGVSTHNEAQFRAAITDFGGLCRCGPVFATRHKENPDPVVGTEFIRRVRALTKQTDRGDRGNHIGARCGSDRSGCGFGGGDQRYFARGESRSTSARVFAGGARGEARSDEWLKQTP